jgi:hypothetical protein
MDSGSAAARVVRAAAATATVVVVVDTLVVVVDTLVVVAGAETLMVTVAEAVLRPHRSWAVYVNVTAPTYPACGT